MGTKPPEAFVLAPIEGDILPYGISYVLIGNAVDYEDSLIPEENYLWSSNQDGLLGSGSSLLVDLSYGEHILTLIVTDSNGNTSSSHVSIFVGSKLFLPVTVK